MSKSRSGNDDAIPDAYPYWWHSENSSSSIEEFVTKYKPSMVQDDGTKPWLWVQNSNTVDNDERREEAIEEAIKLLTEATDRIQKINDDNTIPVRSSKKTGAKSKKQLKEEIQAEFSQKLKDAHKTHDYTSGKWLIFVAPDMVDTVWSRIATSVATGPLSKTVVHLAEVATSPANESASQRLICIYVPDVFDRERVTEVMRILLRNHGVNLSGVKSNLYTEIGLDSKHPSHIQSTIWKNTDLLKENQIKELKDAFYADLQGQQKKSGTNSENKKPLPKPKAVEDDPFASSEDEASKGEKRKSKDEDDEDDERPKKKTR